jgi:hypothetical protein
MGWQRFVLAEAVLLAVVLAQENLTLPKISRKLVSNFALPRYFSNR